MPQLSSNIVFLLQRAPPSFIDEAVKKIQDRDVGDGLKTEAPAGGQPELPVPSNGLPVAHPLAVREQQSSAPSTAPLVAPAPLVTPYKAPAPLVTPYKAPAPLVTPLKTPAPPQGANRTMLLQVGKLELRLISPDKECGKQSAPLPPPSLPPDKYAKILAKIKLLRSFALVVHRLNIFFFIMFNKRDTGISHCTLHKHGPF